MVNHFLVFSPTHFRTHIEDFYMFILSGSIIFRCGTLGLDSFISIWVLHFCFLQLQLLVFVGLGFKWRFQDSVYGLLWILTFLIWVLMVNFSSFCFIWFDLFVYQVLIFWVFWFLVGFLCVYCWELFLFCSVC